MWAGGICFFGFLFFSSIPSVKTSEVCLQERTVNSVPAWKLQSTCVLYIFFELCFHPLLCSCAETAEHLCFCLYSLKEFHKHLDTVVSIACGSGLFYLVIIIRWYFLYHGICPVSPLHNLGEVGILLLYKSCMMVGIFSLHPWIQYGSSLMLNWCSSIWLCLKHTRWHQVSPSLCQQSSIERIRILHKKKKNWHPWNSGVDHVLL